MNEQIKITLNGNLVFAVRGMMLSEIIEGEKPCGGHGKCRKCKVIARGELSKITSIEQEFFSEDELKQGIRLACLTSAMGDCEIETLTKGEDAQIVNEGVMPAFELKPVFSHYGVAIDIGTTTLAGRLYNSHGVLLSTVSMLNPQKVWGADVISRIETALDGKAIELATAIRNAINDMFSVLARKARIDTSAIDGVVITGNTVMLSLLVKESVEPFSRAPFKIERLFGEALTASELDFTNLHGNVSVYLPPCISAFVGADNTCAILATELTKKTTPMMVVDIGTNGEMALWNNGKLIVCSTAAGPAFEGVGISMGMRGVEGAIDKITNVNGTLQAHVIGEVEARGICGSGLVDAVACMIDEQILDESGFLESSSYCIQGAVTLTQKDIRMFQLAKSAICAGLMTLIKSNHLLSSEISTLFIAGGFGNYLHIKNAAKIGLLPKEFTERSKVVGNAALIGAVMILLNKDFKIEVETLSKNAVTLELSSNSIFSDFYMMGMTLGELEGGL